MPVKVRVLFSRPQQEIASLLRDRLNRCATASLVAGFATVEGIEAIAAPIRKHPGKLAHLVVGAGTYRAYQALDDLLAAGVQLDRLFVHLGSTKATASGARYAFYRYHPMLHSKVYLLEGEGIAHAFIGSHNLTGFALLGLNGEASVLLEGGADEPEFSVIRQHISESVSQAVSYDPTMKEAYSWWTTQFFDGLRDKTNDIPREAEAQRTIVVLAARGSDPLPGEGELIYFEIPEALGTIQSLRADVHVYLFATLPPSPVHALSQLSSARAALWCKTEGLEMGRGGVELRANWYIDNRKSPELKAAPDPFRPRPSRGMQQVRVQVRGSVFGRFDYLFDPGKKAWSPVLNQEDSIVAPEGDRAILALLNLVPREDVEWHRVVNLEPAAASGSEAYRLALIESAPESGSFILMSLRRRRRYDQEEA